MGSQNKKILLMLAILPSLLFSTRCGDSESSTSPNKETFGISGFTYNQEQCQASFTISISSPIEESLAIEILDADDIQTISTLHFLIIVLTLRILNKPKQSP